jgi:hypothetical protein
MMEDALKLKEKPNRYLTTEPIQAGNFVGLTTVPMFIVTVVVSAFYFPVSGFKSMCNVIAHRLQPLCNPVATLPAARLHAQSFVLSRDA